MLIMCVLPSIRQIRHGRNTTEAPDGVGSTHLNSDGVQNHSVDSTLEIARCFLRLANLPSAALDRLRNRDTCRLRGLLQCGHATRRCAPYIRRGAATEAMMFINRPVILALALNGRLADATAAQPQGPAPVAKSVRDEGHQAHEGRLHYQV